MDIERFTAQVRNPERTREELETMRANAIDKNATEFVRVVDDVLLERFPNKLTKKGGGKTSTTAVFRSKTEHFESGKEAYLWLVEQFCRFHKIVLVEYDQLHTRAGNRSRGKRFSRNHQSLFPEGSRRRGDPSYYAAVGDGWYADVNLNHDDKFAALLQLSYLAKLEYEQDWEFKVHGATEQLKEHQKRVIRGRKLLDELFSK
jgi:hypothetical protein